jgi:nitric oxide reductase subunit B
VLQLFNSVNEGYYEARTLGYISEPGNVILEWMRMPGDVIFILGGIVPFLWITWLGIRYGIEATTQEVPPETLYVEEHPEAKEDRTGLPVGVGAADAADAAVPESRTRYRSNRRAPDRDEDPRNGRDR